MTTILWAAPAQGQHKESSDPIKLPAYISGSGQVRVRAMLDQKGPVILLLDSGACHSVLDKNLVKSLRLATRKFNVKGLPCGAFESITEPSVSINGTQPPGQKFVLESLDRLFPGQPINYEGMLGHDLFSRYVIRVDYDKSYVTLHDPKGYRYPSRGKRLDFRMEKLLPVVDVYLRSLDGRTVKGSFVLDTAAECTVCMTERFLKANKLMGENDVFLSYRALYVGDIPVTSGDVNTTADRQLAGTEFDGLVGSYFLRDYNIALDYSRGQLILEPRNSP